MSIDKEYGKYIPICDGCWDTLPPENTHNDARHAIKEAGWSTKNTDGEWLNLCPQCEEV